MLRRKKLSPDFSPYSFLRSSKVDASFPFVHLYFYCYIRFLDLFPCFVCRGKRTEQSRTEEALSSSSCTHFIIFRILEYNFLDFFCYVRYSTLNNQATFKKAGRRGIMWVLGTHLRIFCFIEINFHCMTY